MILGVNILGFVAGCTHEAYGVIFGMVLLVQLGRFLLRNRFAHFFRYMLMYFGYLIGFFICFFNPGNFNRAAQSHESALRTVPLLERIGNSVYIHGYIAYRLWIVPVVVLPVLLLALAVLLKKRIIRAGDIANAVINNLEWLMGFAMSALTWGLVAEVVIYGMLATNILLIIGTLRILGELYGVAAGRLPVLADRRIWQTLTAVSMAALLVLAGVSWPDIASVHRTAGVWRQKICEARASGAEETEVPAYPEGLNYKFYETTINDMAYDQAAYRVVYQTWVKPVKTETAR